MSWCILRMRGHSTLDVVTSLRERGLEVWTPTGMQRRYRPRSTKFVDKKAPLLPTFAFARSHHIPQLLAISHSLGPDHLPFTVFQRGDIIPTAPDAAVRPLMDYEDAQRASWDGFIEAQARKDRQKRKKSAARAYVMGQRVRLENPAFAGLTGEIVMIKNNGDLVLEFAGFARGTTVPSCDVVPIHLSGQVSEQTKAA